MKAIIINSQVKFLEEFDFFQFEGNTFFNLKNINEETLYKWGFRNVVKQTLAEGKKYKEPLAPEVFNTEKDEFIYQIIDIPVLTPEELVQQKLQIETKKYIQRQQDGVEAYALISAEFRLAKLSGQINSATHTTIEENLRPVRDEVLAGQWITALEKLSAIGILSIGEAVYSKLHTQIETYIAENYE